MDAIPSLSSPMPMQTGTLSGVASGGPLGTGKVQSPAGAVDFSGGGTQGVKENFSQNAPSPGGADLFGSGSSKVSDLLKSMVTDFLDNFRPNKLAKNDDERIGASQGPVGGANNAARPAGIIAAGGADNSKSLAHSTITRPVQW